MSKIHVILSYWKKIVVIGLVLALVFGLVAWLSFWTIADVLMERQSNRAEVVTTRLADSLYQVDTVLGDRQIGASLLASVGASGVFLVDAPMTDALHRKVVAALERVAPGNSAPVTTVVNTHAHPDHARGNRFLPGAVEIIAHERARNRLAKSVRPFPLLPPVPPLDPEFLPSRTFESSMELSVNGEPVTLWHFAPAHTDGDVVVVFERSNVAHLGDLFHGVGGHPGVDWKNSGGDPDGLIESLDLLLERLPNDTKLVGGHGGVGQIWSRSDLETYRDLVAEVTDSVRSQTVEGRTLSEVVATGVPSRWSFWFERSRADSVMHGPAEGWLENLYRAFTSMEGQRID